MNMEKLAAQVDSMLQDFLPRAQLRPGQILVVGLSTSEVLGYHIGKESNLDVAKAVFPPFLQAAEREGLFLAVQCCEHLNRALVVSEACAEKYGLTIVNALPRSTAGGAFAEIAHASTDNAVLVEAIQGHAAIDIGDTLVGMHLQPVAVPVRLNTASIGKAHLTAARTRAKYIGGARAVYQ